MTLLDTLKKFKNDLLEKLTNLFNSGNLFGANEVTANLMVGFIMVIMVIIMAICLLLNEVGVFTADKILMRWGTVLSLAVEIPITAINSSKRGDAKWLKYLLTVGLLVQCACMTACLGHNVVLLIALPVVLSIRYFNVKFSRWIFWLTFLVFFLSSGFCATFGIVNLNVFPIDKGTTITVSTTLREAVIAANAERNGYILSYILNDLVPRFIVFSVIGIASVKIAQRGKRLIDVQNDVTKKNARIETELNLATQIQTGMLPCIFPAFPELKQLDLFAKNIPAKEVGGDFYDYFRVDDDHIALVMADVSGKGVGAALFMTISKIVIKNLFQSGNSPADTLTKANKQLCENNEAGLFVTTWAALYEISTGKLTYANAGHNPPIVHKKTGECMYLKGRTGFVLAGMDGFRYKEEIINLDPGDELFLYTDGVTEATNADDELYGEDRFIDIVESVCGKPVEEQIQTVLDDINRFVDGAEQFDDITMMAIRIKND